MAPDASAYATLGLEPGADAAAIERAYKSLIKQHHPDREGGDSARAAEINRAYRELRAALGQKDTLVLVGEEPVDDGGRGWIRAVIALLLALAALLAVTAPIPAYVRQLLQPRSPVLAKPATDPSAARADPMDQPLHFTAVSSAVREAASLIADHDEAALLGASRNCHRQLRLKPSVAQLDRCAAFDDAVLQLQDRDPMWDQGPFSQITVTGRQWRAASALSNDYLAIDGRLDRIRVQVELQLVRATVGPASRPLRQPSAGPPPRTGED